MATSFTFMPESNQCLGLRPSSGSYCVLTTCFAFIQSVSMWSCSHTSVLSIFLPYLRSTCWFPWQSRAPQIVPIRRGCLEQLVTHNTKVACGVEVDHCDKCSYISAIYSFEIPISYSMVPTIQYVEWWRYILWYWWLYIKSMAWCKTAVTPVR